MFTDYNTLTFDDSWTGDSEDLKHLESLVELERLELKGGKITGQFFERLGNLPNLELVKISRTTLGDDDLAQLVTLPHLRQLQILYTPITDGSIQHLEKLEQTSMIVLMGTKVSKDAAEAMDTAMAGTTIQYHRGAFLGVGPGNLVPREAGFAVGLVAPNSAAHKAGIRVGDVISHVDEIPIADFSGLQTVMRERNLGDNVKLQVVRNQKTRTFSITLGDRPDENEPVFLPAAPIPAVPRRK